MKDKDIKTFTYLFIFTMCLILSVLSFLLCLVLEVYYLNYWEVFFFMILPLFLLGCLTSLVLTITNKNEKIVKKGTKKEKA